MDDPRFTSDELPSGEAMRLLSWYRGAGPWPSARRAAIDRLMHPRVGPALSLHPQPTSRRSWRGAAIATGLAAAAALVLWVALPEAGPAADGTQLVAFEVRLSARAQHVTVAGDFNGWDPAATPLQRQGTSNLWRASVPLLPGRHVYTFVVDGRDWVVDPLAPRADGDDLGPANVVAVPGTGE